MSTKAVCTNGRGASVLSEVLVELGLVALGAGMGAAYGLLQNQQTRKAGMPPVWSDPNAMWVGALVGALISIVVIVFLRWFLHAQGCRFGSAGWVDPPRCETFKVTERTVAAPAGTVCPVCPAPAGASAAGVPKGPSAAAVGATTPAAAAAGPMATAAAQYRNIVPEIPGVNVSLFTLPG